MKEEFRKQMLETFIPSVERMIEKEKEHLEFLRKSRRKMMDRKFMVNLSNVDQFISNSEANLAHYQLRLKQYKEFAAK